MLHKLYMIHMKTRWNVESGLTLLQSMLLHDEHVLMSITLSYPPSPPCRDISRKSLTGSIPGTLSTLTTLKWLYVHCSVYAPSLPPFHFETRDTPLNSSHSVIFTFMCALCYINRHTNLSSTPLSSGICPEICFLVPYLLTQLTRTWLSV